MILEVAIQTEALSNESIFCQMSQHREREHCTVKGVHVKKKRSYVRPRF